MAYVRKKGRYSYLVESYRDEDGKPRQRVLAYLGDAEHADEKLEQVKKEHPEWFDEDDAEQEIAPATDDLESESPYAPPWDRRRD